MRFAVDHSCCVCPTTSRRAITLTEAVIVLFIIFILIALLLPGTQHVSGLNRRMMSKNNIKQLVLACHSFMDANKYLPWNGEFRSNTDTAPPVLMAYNGNCDSGSWAYQILPFLDQQHAYDAADVAVIDPPTNLAVVAGNPVLACKIPVLNDPGRNRKGYTTKHQQINGTPATTITYVGPTTDYGINIYLNTNGEFNRGYMGGTSRWKQNNKRTVKEISDGAANTVLIGELYLGVGEYLDDEIQSPITVPGHNGTAAGNNVLMQDTSSPKSGTIFYNSSNPPLAYQVCNGCDPITTSSTQGLYGGPYDSWFAGMADGSVRGIPYDINLTPILSGVTTTGIPIAASDITKLIMPNDGFIPLPE